MEKRFAEALQQQREQMLAEFAVYQQQARGPQAPQPEGSTPATASAGAPTNEEGPSLAKLGESIKKQSASLASKAASSAISTVRSSTFKKKGSEKPKGGKDMKKGDGIDEDVTVEETQIGTQVEGLLAGT